MEQSPRPTEKKSVKYEVRSNGGVLSYETLFHVEQAYLAGWIEPDDEIRQVGDANWVKASQMPKLANLKKAEVKLQGAFVPWIIVAMILGVAALLLLLRGNYFVALALALALASVLFKVTQIAAQKR